MTPLEAVDLDGLERNYMTRGGRLLKGPTLAYIAKLEQAARERDGLRAENETLAVLLDNVVISQSLSKDLRQAAHDEARSYLYGRRARQALSTNGGGNG